MVGAVIFVWSLQKTEMTLCIRVESKKIQKNLLLVQQKKSKGIFYIRAELLKLGNRKEEEEMKSKRKRGFLLILSLLMIMATGRGADAMRFEGGGGTTIDCDVTLSYGASFRAKEPDRDKLGKYNPAARNSDDGNENFDQWDMINNRFSIIADLEIKRGNYGVFIRPRAFYDFVYMGHNANDSPATNNNYQAGSINDVHDFDKEVERALGKSADILDLFAYGKWKLPGERNLDLRVGRQVIQWGESLYIQGGIAGAQAHQDANLSAAPGVEIKEKLLPSEAVYAQVDITENVSFATYYQWKWEKSLYYESGVLLCHQRHVG
ncbi:MAG: DUF1302 domain-containing protein [Anaerolineaceae bacterium]